MSGATDILKETTDADVRNGKTLVNAVEPVRITPEQSFPQPAVKGLLLKAPLGNGPKLYIGGPLHCNVNEGLELGPGAFVSLPIAKIDRLYVIADREPLEGETSEIRWLAL